LGLLLQISIRYWLVRLTGRGFAGAMRRGWIAAWKARRDPGTGVYQRIAKEEKLELSQPPDAGLIENLNRCVDLIRSDQVDQRIRQFYEHRSLYRLEVWSEVYFAGKFVLWLLV